MDVCLDCVALAESVSLWAYVAACIAGSLGIRLVTALLRAWRASVEDGAPFWIAVGRVYCGLGPMPFPASLEPKDRERHRGDYFAAAILGALELLAYPALLKAGLHAFVGAWIGLKLVAQYERWKADRGSFNRFLIENAFVFLLSIWISISLLDYLGDDSLTSARA